MSRVTSYQIARACGVSQPTVSRILGDGGHRYAPATRSRVLEAAQRMGYRLNTAARSIRSGRFHAVALLLSTHDGKSSLPNALFNAVLDGLSDRQQSLIVLKAPDSRLTDDRGIPELLRQSATDGLLIDYTHGIPARLLQLIRQNHVPAVWINSKQDANCVRPDDEDAGYRATARLLDLGHRRIAWSSFNHGPDLPDPHYSHLDRRAGYDRAMRERGLTPRHLLPTTGIDLPGADRPAFAAALLRQPDRPTAVVAYSHSTSIPWLKAAAVVGLDPFADLAVIDFDDVQTAFIERPITTFLGPTAEVGKAAVAMLLDLIDHPGRALPPVTVPFTVAPGAEPRASS